MKHMFINKFKRNEKNAEAPTNWPDNIKTIEQEALELKKISQDITKRLLLCPVFNGCAQTNSIVGSSNTKKVAEQNLGQSLSESSERLSLLNPNVSKILSMLADANNKLGMERLHWASNVENNVLEKLRHCYEDSVPSLLKSRRQLWKRNSDLKALKDKLKALENYSSALSPNSPILPVQDYFTHSIVSSSQVPCESTASNSVLNSSLNCVSNFNNQNGPVTSSQENSKLNQLKSTHDDLETQIDHLKDLSLREHYRFEGSMIDISKAFVNLLKNEATYHQQCLEIIGHVLPDLESSIGNNSIPVFGRELNQHLLTSRRHIAYTIEVCVRHLDNKDTLSEEGLFRIAGGKSKVDTLSSAFNVFRAELIIDQYDHFVIADCLKQYLRSLPEPLLTHYLFDDWIRIFSHKDLETRLAEMNVCLGRLPIAYLNNLSYLIGFLFKLSTFSENNKMTPANLGIIFGPNLLSSHSSSSGILNHSVSSTSAIRKKQRNVSNATQMLKKRSFNSYDIATSTFSGNNGIVSSTEDSSGLERHGSQLDDSSMSKSMVASNINCLVIETLIRYFNYFFPNQSTQFTIDIPPKVFHHSVRPKRQSSFNGLISTNKLHNYHKVNMQSNGMSFNGKEFNRDMSWRSSPQNSTLSQPRYRRVSVDSSTTIDQTRSSFAPKSSATTPNGTKPYDFRNGTVFPSCLYHRRVSEGTIDNLKITNSNNCTGCVDVSDLPDIDSSCLDDFLSSSAKSSNDCDDLTDYGVSAVGKIDGVPETSTSAKYVSKSFHADVYDTLFALHSLKSYNTAVDTYLSRVRSTYEERTLSQSHGISRTPVIKRQTITKPVIEDPMSKSVTNDSTINFTKDNDIKVIPKISVIRRPKPLIHVKLENYRESSPANIETLSANRIDLAEYNGCHGNQSTYSRNALNKLSLKNECSPFALSAIIRYSMPILPDKSVSGNATSNSEYS